MLILVGSLAAALAFAVNRWLISRFGNRAILFLVPAVEEMLKTGLAVAAAVPIWPVHLVFGLMEMAYELRSGVRLPGLTAGLVAVAGHAAFGAVALYVTGITGFWPGGWAAATAAHLAWNRWVLAQTGRI
ncbi:MAG: hypothetical protein KGZ75_03185 [Syntrophomonadaceae bacterium]|jgi:hypothetical protein|nr:hypothetical protein [Syntrophomonadaceae bacterium]